MRGERERERERGEVDEGVPWRVDKAARETAKRGLGWQRGG